MPWGSGNYTRAGAVHTGTTLWNDSATDGDATISSTEHDTADNDLASGIDSCINKDGSNAFTGNADLGTKKITNMAEGSATGDASRWDESVASVSLAGTVLEINFKDGGKVTQELSGIASAGEVTLAGDQTITGKKTFTTNTTPITDLRILDTVYHQVTELTSSSSVAVNVTAASRFWLGNAHTMTITFTIPAASSDTDLGTKFYTAGTIGFRNESGHGAITLSVTATDTAEVGSRSTGAGELYTLVYEIWVIGSSRYVKFTWVSE